MDNRSSPQISSFVLRFVQEEPVQMSSEPNFRGSIRHIQTDEEISFTCWQNALKFMSKFVSGEVFDLPVTSTQISPDSEVLE